MKFKVWGICKVVKYTCYYYLDISRSILYQAVRFVRSNYTKVACKNIQCISSISASLFRSTKWPIKYVLSSHKHLVQKLVSANLYI